MNVAFKCNSEYRIIDNDYKNVASSLKTLSMIENFDEKVIGSAVAVSNLRR